MVGLYAQRTPCMRDTGRLISKSSGMCLSVIPCPAAYPDDRRIGMLKVPNTILCRSCGMATRIICRSSASAADCSQESPWVLETSPLESDNSALGYDAINVKTGVPQAWVAKGRARVRISWQPT
jgi:hypothetical protein